MTGVRQSAVVVRSGLTGVRQVVWAVRAGWDELLAWHSGDTGAGGRGERIEERGVVMGGMNRRWWEGS